MTTTTTAAPGPNPAADPIIEALRELQTESDRWNLAERLFDRIPTGLNGFDVIVDAATAAGVAGKLKPNTLRLYRDTAARWPKADRIPNVSFSAHREAMVADGGTTGAVKVLTGLVKSEGGPDRVTVASVRRQIAVQKGKVPASAKAKNPTSIDVVKDLIDGAPKLIASIDSGVDVLDLDAIHKGLTKAITHVEKLRSRAAAKAAKAKAAKAPVATNKPKATANGSTTTPAKKAPAAKAAGDLRNL